MKIRNGFVSNSSSSSFIVAVEDSNKPLKISINVENECDTIRTLEELKNCDHYKYDDDDELAENEEYQNAVKAISEGKILKFFSASNEDDSIMSGLYGTSLEPEMFEDKNVTIICDGNY